MVFTDSGDLLLASCSQDFYIRIWRVISNKARNEEIYKEMDSGKLHLKGNFFDLSMNGTSIYFIILRK